MTQQPIFRWYFLGICAIALQMIAMLFLGGWQIKKICLHEYISFKLSVAVAGLFILFAAYLALNIYQTIRYTSMTLGGVLCSEILFLPVAYYLFQSHRIVISIFLLLTILLTIPIFILRGSYGEQHRNAFFD